MPQQLDPSDAPIAPLEQQEEQQQTPVQQQEQQQSQHREQPALMRLETPPTPTLQLHAQQAFKLQRSHFFGSGASSPFSSTNGSMRSSLDRPAATLTHCSTSGSVRSSLDRPHLPPFSSASSNGSARSSLDMPHVAPFSGGYNSVRSSLDRPHLTPFSSAASSLRNSLDRTASQLPALQRRPLYSAVPANCGKKLVMVIDADPSAHDIVCGLLSALSEFDFSRCCSGEEALMQLERWDHLPDVILLEMALPGMDGLAVCRRIRESYGRVELPIIMSSPEHPQEEDTQAALEAGVNDFIAKPIRQGELLARLSAHILLPQLVASEVDRHHNYALLEAMLPPRIITRLKSGCSVIAEQHREVTILFSDICNFTELCAEHPTEFIIAMLNELFTRFDTASDKHGIYKVETIGDAYMAVCGHDSDHPDHALRMMAMAADMLEAVKTVSKTVGHDLQIRVGMHTGPAFSGVVGVKCPRYCFFGDTVNTASRMESHGFPMCVHYSQSTKDALERGWAWSSTREGGSGAMTMPGDVSCGLRTVKGKKEKMTTFCAKLGDYEQALVQLGLANAEARASPDNKTQEGQEEEEQDLSLGYTSQASAQPQLPKQPSPHHQQQQQQQQCDWLDCGLWQECASPSHGLADIPEDSNGSNAVCVTSPVLPRWHLISTTKDFDAVSSEWVQSLPPVQLDSSQSLYPVQSAQPVQLHAVQSVQLMPVLTPVLTPAVQLTPVVVARPSVDGAAPLSPATPPCNSMVTADEGFAWGGDSANTSNNSSRATSPEAKQGAMQGGWQQQRSMRSLFMSAYPAGGTGQHSISGSGMRSPRSPYYAATRMQGNSSRRATTEAVSDRGMAPVHADSNSASLTTTEGRTLWFDDRCHTHQGSQQRRATAEACDDRCNTQRARSLRRWRSMSAELGGAVVSVSGTAISGGGSDDSACASPSCNGLHRGRVSHTNSSGHLRSGRWHAANHSQGVQAWNGSVQDELRRVVEARLSGSHAMQRCGSPNGPGSPDFALPSTSEGSLW